MLPPTGWGAADGFPAVTFNQLAGVLPAIIFPAATLVQLIRVIRGRTGESVSVMTWLLFGFANLAIYFYAERYTEWQAILGMLVTAVFDFAIVMVALVSRIDARAADETVGRPPATEPAGSHLVLPRRALD